MSTVKCGTGCNKTFEITFLTTFVKSCIDKTIIGEVECMPLDDIDRALKPKIKMSFSKYAKTLGYKNASTFVESLGYIVRSGHVYLNKYGKKSSSIPVAVSQYILNSKEEEKLSKCKPFKQDYDGGSINECDANDDCCVNDGVENDGGCVNDGDGVNQCYADKYDVSLFDDNNAHDENQTIASQDHDNVFEEKENERSDEVQNPVVENMQSSQKPSVQPTCIDRLINPSLSVFQKPITYEKNEEDLAEEAFLEEMGRRRQQRLSSLRKTKPTLFELIL